MIEDVEIILKTPFAEIINSALVLKLLNVYSKLYLNGGQPGTCGACHRDYYRQIITNGMDLAKKYEEAKNRTCKPKWNGLKYINTTARHWNSELLTDGEAIMLLENKHLTINDFDVLPADYGKPIPEEKIIQDFKQRHAPRKRK